MTTMKISVLGAGAWGTALAIQAARAGQVTRIGALALHRRGLGRITRPQQHLVAGGRADRQRRAPGPGAEDGDLHATGPEASARALS